MARYDFNHLEGRATKLVEAGEIADAIKIYLFTADGDKSLDAGYLGEKLGDCYEKLGDLRIAGSRAESSFRISSAGHPSFKQYAAKILLSQLRAAASVEGDHR
ncbi:hypothetical protein N2599_11395 [Rhizobium sullae]|uniref:Uncharacterized protein n=1 Tax=Rhizobium sullae TaxID=50338 RepID=A0ABY5XE31_RHISU|nr:hypothetical protein [Rhizobium sullae]UWU12780.1 hypothetical protein N2599_11395 [Rhizobium sullae]